MHFNPEADLEPSPVSTLEIFRVFQKQKNSIVDVRFGSK